MNFSLKLCGHFWPWIEFCKLINIFVYITEHWNLFYGKPAAKIEGFFKTCRVRISTSELKIAKLYSKNCEAQMLRNVSPSPLQFHCELKNLYYTSKHDKTFLGRARKHITQLFNQNNAWGQKLFLNCQRYSHFVQHTYWYLGKAEWP